MREEFEKLPEVAEILKNNHEIKFEDGGYVYYGLDKLTALVAMFIGGAWYAYQEQQKKKEKVLSRINQFESQSVDDKRLFLNDLLTEIKELLK